MKRGDIFLVRRGAKNDPKKRRAYLLLSRQELIENQFPTVICAPICTKYDGCKTQVEVGVEHGLKHDSTVYCDVLVSLEKTQLTNLLAPCSLPKWKKSTRLFVWHWLFDNFTLLLKRPEAAPFHCSLSTAFH